MIFKSVPFFISLLFFLSTIAAATPADYVSGLEEMAKQTDIYKSYQVKDGRIPKLAVSDFHLYNISERVLAEGYNYFSISPSPIVGESAIGVTYVDLKGQRFWVGRRDDNQFPENVFSWNAREVCTKARIAAGYKSAQDDKFNKATNALTQDANDLNAVGQIALYYNDKAQYEGEGLELYFEFLKKFIFIKEKRGEGLNPNADLGYLMDVAICLNKDSEYLNIINSMPEKDSARITSKRQYDSFKKREQSNAFERKQICRKYD